MDFCGIEKCDIIFYLSEIYRILNRHVLVIDNSYSQDLYKAVSDGTAADVTERGFVVYTHDVSFGKKALKKFDVVIFYEGLNPEEINIINSDHVFLMPDYSESSIRQLREALDGLGVSGDEHRRWMLILRDKVTKKIRDRHVREMINPDCMLVGTIAYDRTDYARYINLTHNGRQNVRGISRDMADALTYMLSVIEGISVSSAAKIIKKA